MDGWCLDVRTSGHAAFIRSWREKRGRWVLTSRWGKELRRVRFAIGSDGGTWETRGRDLGFGSCCVRWTVILGVCAVGEHVAFIQGAERLALGTAADRWVSDGRCA